jgi:membrane-bound lytic murein transglycosylase B
LTVVLAVGPASAASGAAPVRGAGVVAAAVRDLADVSGPGEAPAPATHAAFLDRTPAVEPVLAAERSAGEPDVPPRVLAAYRRAAEAIDVTDPGCGVTWWMLAAIGKMESDHADGGRVDASGATAEPIRGPWLDGAATWKRAEGPMQFLPATWAAYGEAGNPDDVDDAALGAARFLCAGTGDLADTAHLSAAVFRYNRSDVYVAAVLRWALDYSTGVPSGGAPGTDRDASAAAAAAVAAAVAYADAQLGLPYVWGGNGPDHGDAGFDCSGLTHAAYVAAGIPTPRTAQGQYDAGPRLASGEEPAIGDLVFYGTPDRVHHVGLYTGDGWMINAPTFGMPVRTAHYRWPGDDYLGATRPAARPGSLLPAQLLAPVPRKPRVTSGNGAHEAPQPARRTTPTPTAVATPVLVPVPVPVPTPTPTPTPAPGRPTVVDRSRPTPPPSSVTVPPTTTSVATPTSRPVTTPPVTTPPQRPTTPKPTAQARSQRTLTVTSAQAAALLASAGAGRSVTVLRRDDATGEVVLLLREVVAR